MKDKVLRGTFSFLFLNKIGFLFNYIFTNNVNYDII